MYPTTPQRYLCRAFAHSGDSISIWQQEYACATPEEAKVQFKQLLEQRELEAELITVRRLKAIKPQQP